MRFFRLCEKPDSIMCYLPLEMASSTAAALYYYSTNIDTVIANAYYIGKVLYPDEFRDIDPAEKADEII